MAFFQRYSDTFKGKITFVGNSLGFGTNYINTGIGAYMATIPTLTASGYPSPSTFDWSKNGSTGVLSLPSGSIVRHAEVIWGGSVQGVTVPNGTQTTLTTTILNTPISFITPVSAQTIACDTITASQTASLGGQYFYTRSVDVTTLVKAGGNGIYAAGGIPGTMNPGNLYATDAGWVLAVIYENPSFDFSNLNLYIGAEGIVKNSTPIDTTISGFATPASGKVISRVLVMAQEGNPDIVGDSLLLGNTISALTVLTGPNNPANNFFASTINNDTGNYDKLGSFGNLNQTPGTYTSFVRSGIDITNVDGSNTFTNSQRTAVVRFQTVGDTYAVSALGVQIQVQSPIISFGKQVNSGYAVLGDTIVYTIVVGNTGKTSADNFFIQDTMPTGVTFVENSINSTASFNGNNIETGITLQNSLGVNQVATISWLGVITTVPSNGKINNQATAYYSFISAPGLPPITGTQTSTGANTNVVYENLSIFKDENKSFAILGDTIVYSLYIKNNGNVDCLGVKLIDTEPTGTVFISNSLFINGTNSSINVNNGIDLGTISVGQGYTINFTVLALTPPNNNFLINNGLLKYNYILNPSTPNVSAAKISNTVTLPFGYAKLSLVKNVDKFYTTVGETIQYTLTIYNSGNLSASNIFLIDTQPKGITYIQNSLTINEVATLSDINLGFTIPSINPLETITVTFLGEI